MASSRVESSSTILSAFWFCSYFTWKKNSRVMKRIYITTQGYPKISTTRADPTSTIWAPGLMPTVWAMLPSVTWRTNTPVLFPPTTVSCVSSASPWKEMLRTRSLMRIALGRHRRRKGGTDSQLENEEEGKWCWCFREWLYILNTYIYIHTVYTSC